jgi:hypothetical protein
MPTAAIAAAAAGVPGDFHIDGRGALHDAQGAALM